MAGVWLTDLADVLRAAGISVIEETYVQGRYKGLSWKKVGFGGRGLVDFRFILWHHDSSPMGDSPGALSWMKYYANDGAGTDLTPAAACWVCTGCNGAHQSGTWHIYAAGLSNRAGRGCGGWGVGQSMNNYSLGIETDHTEGEPWKGPKKETQLASLRAGTAAIFKSYELDPTPALLFHRTWTDGGVDGVPLAAWAWQGGTRGRKTDPSGLDLAEERRIVAALMNGTDAGRVDALRARLTSLIARRTAARKAGDTVRLEQVRTRIANIRARIRKFTGKA